MADIVSLKHPDPSAEPAVQIVVLPSSGAEPPPLADARAALPDINVCNDLDQALGTDKAHPVVIGMRSPLVTLAKTIESDVDLEDALHSWQGWLEDVLVACRPHRRRLLLVDATALVGGHTAVFEAIRTRFDLHDPAVTEGAGAAPDTAPPELEPAADPLSLMIADWMIGKNPQARALVGEIEAMMSVAAPRLPAPIDTAAAARAAARAAQSDRATLETRAAELAEDGDRLRDSLARSASDLEESTARITLLSEEREAAMAAKDALAEEVPLLRESLEQVLAELDETVRRRSEAEDRAAEQAARIEALEGDRATLETRAAELAEDGDRLRDSLAQLASGLEEQTQQLTEAEARAAEDAGRLRVLAEERDAARTEAEALAGKLDTSEKASTELGEENALLRESLDHLKTELERRIPEMASRIDHLEQSLSTARKNRQSARDRVTALQNTLDTTKTRLKHKTRDMTKLKEETDSALARLREERDMLRAEIAHIHGSRSWRVTAPMRRLRSLLGR